MRVRRSVPFTGWYAVLALAVIAALGATTVVGAGLSLWRGSSSQRVLGAVSEPILRHGSGVVTVPARTTGKPHQAAKPTPVSPAVPVQAVRQQRQPAGPVTRTPRTPTRTAAHRPSVAEPLTRPLRSFPLLHLARPVGLPAQAHFFALGRHSAVSVLVIFGHPARVGVHLMVTPVSSVLPQLMADHEKPDLAKPDHAKPDHAKPDQDNPEHAKPEHDKPEHDAHHDDCD